MFELSTSKVKNIRKVGKRSVYDLSIENNHNFFCNDILVHNCDYHGELMIIVYKVFKPGMGSLENMKYYTIQKGDRIAQITIEPVHRIKWEPVDKIDDSDSIRKDGGFGSTGKN